MNAVGKNLIAGSRVTVLIMIIGLPWPVGCSGGSGGSGVSPAYRARIADFKTLYGKDDAWESWMLANASRYDATFAISSTKPSVLDISFRYETVPIAYNPPWANEAEHMMALTIMAEGAYVGYTFNFVFNGNTSTSYANVIAGISQTTSYSLGKDVFLFFETIFNHEFGHRMGLLHHYDDVSQIGDGMHMPPGETTCIMDRNSTMFCSACRTALGVPLDVTDTTAMDMAMNDILSRYP
jgi:predicted Zn-dependent protease